ncbi:MAG: hypothetical protein KDA61_05555 [Planctomycetales bacterium]|nr:hypothetical protein [Planctomycetales bacterium]
MARKKLGLVHTSATLVAPFAELCKEHLPDVAVFNIVDDSLIKDVIEKGELTTATTRRVLAHVTAAEQAGADQILVTCSSIGPAVEASAHFVETPVLRVDQPMADEVVQRGPRIGVIATLPTTLEPTSDLVRRRALAAGKTIELTSRLCEGAFEALMSGDAQRHDAMVLAALKELIATVDVVALAQASMARVAQQIAPAPGQATILASPPLAVQRLAQLL